MTTIAYDGTTLAGDRKMDYHATEVQKVFRLPDGSLIGGAGDMSWYLRALEWLRDPTKNERPDMEADKFTTLRVDHTGQAFVRFWPGTEIPVESPFAIGSGSDYAMGAMAMGASAEGAIAIAQRFDKSTGARVDTLVYEAPKVTIEIVNEGVTLAFRP